MADPLDIADFIARNRQAGGVNALLAEALAANLAQPSNVTQQPERAQPGLFGVGRQPGSRSFTGALGKLAPGGLAGLLASIRNR